MKIQNYKSPYSAPGFRNKRYTLDDLEADEQFQEISERFLNSVGEQSDDIFEYLRDSDFNLLSGMQRAMDSDRFTDQQKRDYAYLRSKFDGADMGSLKQYLELIKDSSFDCVASSMAIHNFDKKTRAKLLPEIYRILKPNGLFVNLDKYVSDNAEEEQKSFEKEFIKFNKLREMGRADLAERAITHEEEDRHADYIMKEQESVKLMQQLGFKNIKIHKRHNREAILSCVK